MTTPADPVVSGVPYDVRELDGAAPGALEDFVGEHVLLLSGHTGDHRVAGSGGDELDGGLRFYEKDAASTKDVRTWTISPSDGGFVAVSGA
ncbi:MAG TPA: hypothetical protein VK935_03720 [Actinomycetospora sp.]|nr:hypothetical protein [Actinomycetospora sp.]